MRSDALGFFWEDTPIVKALKAEKAKRTPPEPTWLSPDYLPGLEEARAFNVPMMLEHELITSGPDEELILDIESYPNYFLLSLESTKTGKFMCFERSQWADFDSNYLRWVLENFCTVSFNGIKYDMVIAALACDGHGPEILNWATVQLIEEEQRPQDILKRFKCKKLKANHIDLIEVAPLRANLKIYGGRLHCKRMQDLPFPPGTVLSYEQALIVRYYNVNDLRNTVLLRNSLRPQIDLRYEMSNEYGIDLRSKSDAQIAEAVFADAMTRINGVRPKQPEIEPGTTYKYQVPHFIKFQSPLMNWALEKIRRANFVVGEFGAVTMPPELADLELPMGLSVYRMGIGGLHSSEKSTGYVSDAYHVLKDRDVVSYYPMIILILGLFPEHLGIAWLQEFRAIVMRRIDAKKKAGACKKALDKINEKFWKDVAESLKIVINGSFGKLGSKYSVLYAPQLLIQVTITGQLCLLMMIEAMEMIHMNCVSANTDGVVINVPRNRIAEYEAVIKWWEQTTGFETEETEYLALYSRDVNNYIAVKAPGPDGKIETKTKGEYANPWSDPTKIEPRMHKNPANQVCVLAIEALLTKGIPLDHTIRNCTDICQFVSVRTVSGGAVKDGEFLGKSLRWYYSVNERDSEIVYAKSGNKVPRSDGARPCLELPDTLPDDIDYEWYIKEAIAQLTDLSFYKE